MTQDKVRGRNNFLKLALGFRLGLFDLKMQNRRNSRTILRILCLKIGQRWPEDEMHKWGSYFVPVPNVIDLKKPERFIDDPITDILHNGARKLLAQSRC